MADALGDPTPRASGRLTLNPIAHLDPIGTLMLLIFRFGWAKPVPINPMYFDDRQRGMLLTGLAGPLSNFVMATVSAYLLLQLQFLSTTVLVMLYFLMMYNIWLGLFNLIPIPPLDGSHIARGLTRYGSTAWHLMNQIDQYGWVILLVLVMTRTVGMILGPVANVVQQFLFVLVSPLVF